MFQRGSLSVTLTWEGQPNVRIFRNRELVGIAELSPEHGLMNGKEVCPMSPPEWAIAKERAVEWMKDNPRPAPAA